LSMQKTPHCWRRLVLQTRNVSVADKLRLEFAVPIFLWVRNRKIKDADAETRFALIDAPVAGADHDAFSGFLFSAKVNHCVGDRRIAIDRVSARPKKQIAGPQILQFE
jgi:hypothetical protein